MIPFGVSGTSERFFKVLSMVSPPSPLAGQSGWIDWHEEVWIGQLRDFGRYDPQQFWPNIIVCKMILDAKRPESN